MSDRPTDADRPDADLPEEDVSAEDPPQAGTFFLEDEAPDEALKKDAAAFDRVQTRTEDVNEHEIETENEREYKKKMQDMKMRSVLEQTTAIDSSV